MTRHRIDVRGNEIRPPSIWPVVTAMGITGLVGGLLIALGGTTAAEPAPLEPPAELSYVCATVGAVR